ncbi:MAG: LysM peptidoglycan-binding domain-containing protein [Bacilli bacterium]|nr:LysM peptidoglycan-binding domain-containing protein [Bacilli bacterium]
MYKIYTVSNNETIASIASDLKITEADLRKINGFSPNYVLSVSEQIIVPVTNATYFDVYKVQTGDTIYDIARKNDISVADLLLLNGLQKYDYIYPNQELLVPKTDIQFYITKESDTLSSLLEELKTSLEELYRYNPIIYLEPDQLIIVKE